MKNIKTLAKATETTTIDELKTIVNNDSVNFETLTDNERFSVLIYAELAKALKSKEYELLLDCNYSKSKNELPVVTYYRLIDSSSNTSLIQFYNHCNAKAGTSYFRLATSCAKAVREKLRDELSFDIKVNQKTLKYKHSEKRQIDYSDVVSTAKAVCALFKNSDTTTATTTE